MLYTNHFKFPIYEGKDYVNYMVTYNDTIKSIDANLFEVTEQISTTSVNFEKIISDVENIKKSLETSIENLETLSNSVSVNTSDISSLATKVNEINKDLLAQNQLVEKLDTMTDSLNEKLINIQYELTELEKTVTGLSNEYVMLEEKINENSSSIIMLKNNTPVESFIVKNSDIIKTLEYSCTLEELNRIVLEVTTPLGCYAMPTLSVGNPEQSLNITLEDGNATISFLATRKTDGTFTLQVNCSDILPNVTTFKIYQF